MSPVAPNVNIPSLWDALKGAWNVQLGQALRNADASTACARSRGLMAIWGLHMDLHQHQARPEHNMHRTAAVICAVFAFVPAAQALEVGDVVWTSSNGVGLTVVSMARNMRDVVEFRAQALEANAAEYCERYEQLESSSAKWQACVERSQGPEQRIEVRCKTRTIMLKSGSYRPGGGGGPWVSTGNQNWIAHLDDLYKQACQPRR